MTRGGPVTGIIFDKDGTLFDFQSTWAGPFRKLVEQLGAGGNQGRVAAAIGFDLTAERFLPESPVIAGTSGEVAELLAEATGQGFDRVLDVMNAVGGEARQMPAVPLAECLAALKPGRKLGLVTNDTEGPAKAHLSQEGILGLFDFVAGYDSGHGAKPAPGQLVAFCAATGLDASEVIMVGDSRHDLVAGRAANMRTVAVLTGVAVADELADLADVILPDIGHLEAWLSDGVVPG